MTFEIGDANEYSDSTVASAYNLFDLRLAYSYRDQ